jgi:hypothetical protein
VPQAPKELEPSSEAESSGEQPSLVKIQYRPHSDPIILATCDQLVITNPKRRSAAQAGRDQWFPYYAGFSSDFARQLIASGALEGSTLMDPWNGSGTTTSSGALNGCKAIGFDLNPVMAVVAKARLLPQHEVASIAPLLADILKKAALARSGPDAGDPLQIWFAPDAAMAVRRIEQAIYRLLVSATDDGGALDSIQDLSSLAAFFYVALFGAVRSLLHRFKGSNPTWITRPRTVNSRTRPAASSVRASFATYVKHMVASSPSVAGEREYCGADSTIRVASSESLPVRRGTIDFVLSSPPYCTRIDYGIATSPELAVLGFRVDTNLGELRSRFIGTPTIHTDTPNPEVSWGGTCSEVLERISHHPSKAAKAYYYKTYVQYFAAMARSFSEMSRCLKRRGRCVVVVQDSYFKDVRIDLAAIFAEMALSSSLELRRQVDFPITRTFGSINPRSRSYRNASSATESVLCFVKDA